MKKNIDILLLARPDHSLTIYKALCQQKKLSFHFLTFRVLKKIWKFLGIKRISYVDKNATILLYLSFRHVLKFNFHKFTRLNEAKYFGQGVDSMFAKYTPNIIHYWPFYCYEKVDEYKKLHPDVITIADQSMPNPIFLMKYMQPIYEKYGIISDNTYLKAYSEEILKHFDRADYIAVPSKFVEDTMKITFPNHKYIRISYGITPSKYYSYSSIEQKYKIENFVYAGSISVEKGSDVILEYFSKHPDLSLHLYGTQNVAQKDIFEPFKKFDNIHFYGSVSKDVLQQAFCRMDVGIHPSRYDAYSLAVGEEIGTGLPVIVSDKTGSKDDVKENGWGLVFSLEDEKSLDQAITEMMDMNRYNTFKKNIHDYLCGNHQEYGDSVVEMYSNLLLKRK